MKNTSSDGYEYETLAQKLLGKPPDTERNRHLALLRFRRFDEGYIRAWYEGWDSSQAGDPRSRCATNAALAADAWARANPTRFDPHYDQSHGTCRAGVAGALPAPAPAVHAEDEPPLPGGVGP